MERKHHTANSRNNSPEIKELMDYMARHHDNRLNTMTNEQKEIFEKFKDRRVEYTSYAEEAIFPPGSEVGNRGATRHLNQYKRG